jgi:hypothetical protein
MTTSKSFQALRRANPRTRAGFAQSVDAVGDAVRAQIVTSAPAPRIRRPRRRLVRLSAAGASLAVAAGVAVFLTVGSPSGGPGVENAVAAIQKAATVTEASAERSGAAVMRITHNGEPWAGITVRWHGGDVAILHDAPRGRGKAGSGLLVVDGMMYGVEDGRWVELGSPKSIDPDSGTTPDEYLAAVRQDIGGVTLRRFTGAMTGLQSTRLDDGSTVYRGAVAARLIAPETGFKEGESIRVFPFGFVAHDEAHDASAPLDTAVTVGPGGVIREIAVAWGTWTYTVTYRNLGKAGPVVAPANARPFPDRRVGGSK